MTLPYGFLQHISQAEALGLLQGVDAVDEFGAQRRRGGGVFGFVPDFQSGEAGVDFLQIVVVADRGPDVHGAVPMVFRLFDLLFRLFPIPRRGAGLI